MLAVRDLAIEGGGDLLEVRLDVLDEALEGLLDFLVVGSTSGGDIKVGARLARRRIEITAIENEFREAVVALELAVEQGGVEGLEGLPVGGVEI